MDSKEMVLFKGLMVPVFTPMFDDGPVNYDMIKPYAKYLSSKGLKAVLVNGTTGEGTALTITERKKVCTAWKEACTELNMLLMVQVAGGAMVETIEMARHCADQKVDAILTLPDLFFKPKTCHELYEYMTDVSFHCSDIPIYYYHIPAYTDVNLPMDEFMKITSRMLPAFAGIKYTSGDLEMGLKCLQHGQVFLGSDTILAGAVALGFECAIMTSLNIHPEYSFKIIELMNAGDVKGARKQQLKLNEFIKTTLGKCKLTTLRIIAGTNPTSTLLDNNMWVTAMKRAFNDLNRESQQLDMGVVRKPIQLPIKYRNQ